MYRMYSSVVENEKENQSGDQGLLTSGIKFKTGGTESNLHGVRAFLGDYK